MYAQRSNVGRGRERTPYTTLRQYQNHTDCGCDADVPVMNNSPLQPNNPSCLNGYHLAMVYAPEQVFKNLYDCEQWLDKGTIFRDLDFPFKGSRKGR